MGYISGIIDVRFFETTAGRSQPMEFLLSLSEKDTFGAHGVKAPLSMKPIKGQRNRGLWEIRTGGLRTFYCVKGRTCWILHACKKQDQERGIDAARTRMEKL